MITQRLQLFAIVVGVIFLVMMIELIRKNRQVLNWISRLIGVYSPVNALFAILLCCGLVLMISFSVIVSGNKKAEVRLTQKISLLENRIRELEKQTKDAGTEAAEEKKE